MPADGRRRGRHAPGRHPTRRPPGLVAPLVYVPDGTSQPETHAFADVVPPLVYSSPPDVTSKGNTEGTAILVLRHAGTDGPPPLASFREWGLVADEPGILIRDGFRRYRVLWTDLDSVELVDRPARSSRRGRRPTEMVVVTVHHVRMRVRLPSASRRDLLWLGQTLLAMRDAYSSRSGGRNMAAPVGATPATPWPLAHPPVWTPPREWGAMFDVVLQMRDTGDRTLPPKILKAPGVRADDEGITVDGSIIRIPWRELSGVDLVRRSGGETNVWPVLITHHHGAFPVVALNGSPELGGKPYEIARTLLAMRDAYTPEAGAPTRPSRTPQPPWR